MAKNKARFLSRLKFMLRRSKEVEFLSVNRSGGDDYNQIQFEFLCLRITVMFRFQFNISSRILGWLMRFLAGPPKPRSRVWKRYGRVYVQFHGWLLEKRLIHMMMILEISWSGIHLEPDSKAVKQSTTNLSSIVFPSRSGSKFQFCETWIWLISNAR